MTMKTRQKAIGNRQKGWIRLRRDCFILIVPVCVLMVLSVGGCQQESIKQGSFAFEVDRQGQTAKTNIAQSVKIERIGAAKPFGYKSMVYRISDSQFETDYYNRFFVAPDEMIEQKVYRWLSDSGVFADVARWDDTISTAYVLKGNINLLYGDFAEKNRQAAVMEIEFMLTESDTDEVKLKKVYKSTVPFEQRKPDSLVHAYNTCLEEILSELEKDLILKIKK